MTPSPDDEPLTYWVTSHLVLGAAPTDVPGLFAFVDNPAEAVRVIRAGASAVLPPHRFDLAEETLRLAGRSEEGIARDLQIARGFVRRRP